ncbi:MAG: UbiX family flavin prenyltransferase [Candidatus Aenigmatarchaeota archaeon]|nr:MAG: UbiX family flavin prenyltransferase [Candidatus Aenigmarchaeota archaeon]
MSKKVIVGITGSSATILGVRALEELKKAGAETHLIITKAGKDILEDETDYKVKDVEKLATKVYKIDDLFAPISSGSFKTDGMLIAPCSMKTLAGIASGYTDNLLLRAADVVLKERRKLILLTREMPLSYIHIKNMKTVTTAGAVVIPPVLTFYSKPKTIEDMVKHVVGKALDHLGIDTGYKRWN